MVGMAVAVATPLVATVAPPRAVLVVLAVMAAPM
jgi:hypothetical protein